MHEVFVNGGIYNMKIAGVCFTERGRLLAVRICETIEDLHARNERAALSDNNALSIGANRSEVIQDWYCKGEHFPVHDAHFKEIKEPIRDWAGRHFYDADALIFIGAAGIAVRAISQYVTDKRTDPAVIVLDEQGKFCISLLSGHIGGANRFVNELSARLSCIPVITTATDVNDLFSVDTYAKENDMTISNMTYAKEVSAALLAGEPVGFYTNFPVEGKLPQGLFWSDKLEEARASKAELPDGGTSLGIYISPSYHRAYFDHTLWLIPRCLVIGIGCRKGTSVSQIRSLVDETLREYSLYPEAIARITSIDLKKDEPGLLAFCEKNSVQLHTYSAEELKRVQGSFTPSAFVEQTTGVDNICERSAILFALENGGGDLIIRKKARDGVTVAAALLNRRIRF